MASQHHTPSTLYPREKDPRLKVVIDRNQASEENYWVV